MPHQKPSIAKEVAVGSGERVQFLDAFKTLLVLGMVVAHVIQLLGRGLGAPAGQYSEFINLMSFSGFMLAFGIGVGLPFRVRGGRGALARLQAAAIMLAGVYLSSLAFAVLVDRDRLTVGLVVDLLTLKVLFGYSEFLATFFVLYLIIAVCRPALDALAQRPLLILAGIVLGLLATLITTDARFPLLATIVGLRDGASFPLLAYLPWFLVGLYFGRREGRLRVWQVLAAALPTAAFYAYLWFRREPPERFPPSALWVAGPALWLMAYLGISHALASRLRLPRWLLATGTHVLCALLFSNLAIFGTQYAFGRPARDPGSLVLVAGAILGATMLYCVAWDAFWRRRHRSKAAAAASHLRL